MCPSLIPSPYSWWTLAPARTRASLPKDPSPSSVPVSPPSPYRGTVSAATVSSSREPSDACSQPPHLPTVPALCPPPSSPPLSVILLTHRLSGGTRTRRCLGGPCRHPLPEGGRQGHHRARHTVRAPSRVVDPPPTAHRRPTPAATLHLRCSTTGGSRSASATTRAPPPTWASGASLLATPPTVWPSLARGSACTPPRDLQATLRSSARYGAASRVSLQTPAPPPSLGPASAAAGRRPQRGSIFSGPTSHSAL